MEAFPRLSRSCASGTLCAAAVEHRRAINPHRDQFISPTCLWSEWTAYGSVGPADFCKISERRFRRVARGTNLESYSGLRRGFGEVERDGAIDIDLSHAHGAAFIFVDGLYQPVDIHGIAGAQHLCRVFGAPFTQILGAIGFGRDLLVLHHVMEDPVEDIL